MPRAVLMQHPGADAARATAVGALRGAYGTTPAH